MSTKTFSFFRKVAFAEGLSFIVLLGIAMPLKYAFHFPKAVSIVGGLHGALFVAYIILALEVKSTYRFTSSWLLKALAGSVIPFGTFILDREWKREMEIFAQKK